jgi:hypothetical protein
MAPRPAPERYEPLPGLLGIPAYFVRKLSARGRRTAMVAGALALVALVAGLAVAIPAIVETKAEHAATERRATAQARAARIAELRAELRSVDGRGTPSRGLSGAAAISARWALAADLATAVEADARSRAAAGELAHAPTRVECVRFPVGVDVPNPAADPGLRRGRYSCLAVTAEIPAQSSTRGGTIGYPYRALVDFPSGRYTFCKISGRPGEGSLTRRIDVTVPPACGGEA